MGHAERRLRSDVSVRPARVEKSEAVSGDDSILCIVDDDPSICEAPHEASRHGGPQNAGVKTAQEFLSTKRSDTPSCLVLDVRLPELSGLDLQRELANADPPIQIVFITAASIEGYANN